MRHRRLAAQFSPARRAVAAVTLVMSEAVLITAGVAAALVPARRASRANPMDILRAT